MFFLICLLFLSFSHSNSQSISEQFAEVEPPEVAAASLGISLPDDAYQNFSESSPFLNISKREAKQKSPESALENAEIGKGNKVEAGKTSNKTTKNVGIEESDEDFIDDLGNFLRKTGDKIDEQIEAIQEWAQKRGTDVEKILEKLTAVQDKLMDKFEGQTEEALRNISAIAREAGQKMLAVVKKTGGQSVDKVVENH